MIFTTPVDIRGMTFWVCQGKPKIPGIGVPILALVKVDDAAIGNHRLALFRHGEPGFVSKNLDW